MLIYFLKICLNMIGTLRVLELYRLFYFKTGILSRYMEANLLSIIPNDSFIHAK